MIQLFIHYLSYDTRINPVVWDALVKDQKDQAAIPVPHLNGWTRTEKYPPVRVHARWLSSVSQLFWSISWLRNPSFYFFLPNQRNCWGICPRNDKREVPYSVMRRGVRHRVTRYSLHSSNSTSLDRPDLFTTHSVHIRATHTTLGVRIRRHRSLNFGWLVLI